MTISPTPAVPAADRGRVGRRALVAVQTLDVGRLTSTPVYLAPSSLIAVTGRGPVDSNESSKTTLFAAISLLLGDPAWRLDAPTTGQHAARLLFDPDNAPEGTVYRADHGYVVGVFATSEGLFDDASAITVWLRINRGGDPYLQVRAVEGVRLAVGDTQADRRSNADRLWTTLPGRDTWGQQSFPGTLYGPAAACLSYVDTRGGRKEQRDRSLLGSDLSQLSPEQIATELIALSGFATQFDEERKQRGGYVSAREVVDRLAGEIVQATETSRIAEAAHDRATALAEALSNVVELRRLALTAAVVETSDELAAARTQLVELDRAAEAAAAGVTAAQAALAAVDDAELDETWRQANRRVKDAEETLRRTTANERNSATALERAKDDHDHTAAAAATWEGTRLEEAREQAAVAAAHHRTALEEVGVARQLYSTAEQSLEAIEAGDAGPAVASLTTAGVPARLLVDDLQIDEAEKDRWEALLAPLHDTIAVAPQHTDAARVALRGMPGVLVACGDGPLPDGVIDAPPGAAGLLRWLDATAGPIVDDLVVLADIGFAVSGFDRPRLGRVARVRAAEDALETARTALHDAEKAENRCMQLAEQAASALAATEAATRLPQAVAALEMARTTHRTATDLLAAARHAHDTALEDRGGADARRADAAVVRQRALDDLTAAGTRLSLATTTRNRHRENTVNRLRVGAWVSRLVSAADPAPPVEDGLLERVATTEPAQLSEPDLAALRAWAVAGLDGTETTADQLRRSAREQLLAEVLSRGLDVHVSTNPRSSQNPQYEAPETLAAIGQAAAAFVAAGEVTPEPLAGMLRQDEAFQVLAELVRAEADHRTRVTATQATRAREQLERLDRNHRGAADELHQQRLQLLNQMGALEHLAMTRFRAIEAAFNRIRVRDGGWGAELAVTHHRPDIDGETPDAPWVWQVEPRWARRGPDPATNQLKMVPYRRDANTAQYKLATVQLALAALTSSPDTHGRVLILDELGNDLGTDHRAKVVSALARAADESGLTVLATVQDDLQPVAFRHAGEVVVLHYPSKDDLLNAPTKMLGVDPSRGAIVGPLAQVLASGERDMSWRELWAIYDPAADPTVTAPSAAGGDGQSDTVEVG